MAIWLRSHLRMNLDWWRPEFSCWIGCCSCGDAGFSLFRGCRNACSGRWMIFAGKIPAIVTFLLYDYSFLVLLSSHCIKNIASSILTLFILYFWSHLTYPIRLNNAFDVTDWLFTFQPILNEKSNQVFYSFRDL